jgi:ribosomal protein S6--L-glutamate ligase
MVGGSPLIVKLLEGTQGKGVVLMRNKKKRQKVLLMPKVLMQTY